MSEDTSQEHTLLGHTARWTAATRAIESQRTDRLLNDPWAAALAGEDGGTWITGFSAEGNLAPISLRTRFFDDFLLTTTREHAVHQVVLMAAGLDTRAYRLEWPQTTRLFELDQPQVLAYKERILTAAGAQPACERHTISVDLTGPWTAALQTAGFDPLQPSVWLLEGFLSYLTPEAELHLLDELTLLAAPSSWLGFDTMNNSALTSPWTRFMIEALEKAGTPFQSALDDPEKTLAEHGWQATATQLGDEGANFGRWPYPTIPKIVPDMPRFWLITAQRRSS